MEVLKRIIKLSKSKETYYRKNGQDNAGLVVKLEPRGGYKSRTLLPITSETLEKASSPVNSTRKVDINSKDDHQHEHNWSNSGRKEYDKPIWNLRLGNFLEHPTEDDEEIIPEVLRKYYLDTFFNVCDICGAEKTNKRQDATRGL